MKRMENAATAARGATLMALLAMTLGGCASDPAVTGSTPLNYRDRHPIVVAQGEETLDFVPGGGPGGLTERQREDIRGFARTWRNEGRGRIVVQLPQGGATDAVAAATARTIRTELVAGGVPSRALVMSSYGASHPSQLAPVRLSFGKLTAEVASQCGQWPEDLGNSLTRTGRNNGDYTNFGCAYQSNMAAMIADPEDVIRPRAETPVSGARRAVVMESYIKGEATAAAGDTEATSVSEGVSQ